MRRVLVALLCVCPLLAALFPSGSPSREKARLSSCLSNQKQIGLAMLAYAADNDGRFPPASAAASPERGGPRRLTNWAFGYPLIVSASGGRTPGLIEPYVRSVGVFHCPEVPVTGDTPRLTYMYNDLAATARGSEIAEPSRTALVCDGQDQLDNTGHARVPGGPPRRSRYNTQGRCDPGRGAVVTDAVSRHTPRGRAGCGRDESRPFGAYLYADGHARALPPAAVYFPPVESAARSHAAAGGPDPAGEMIYQGQTYRATFHLR